MAFAGGTYEITNAAKDFDGSMLTPAKTNSVMVEVADGAATPTLVQALSAMTWDVTRSLWYYLWDTTSVGAGTYRAKCIITGVDGTKSFAFLTIRLKASPF